MDNAERAQQGLHPRDDRPQDGHAQDRPSRQHLRLACVVLHLLWSLGLHVADGCVAPPTFQRSRIDTGAAAYWMMGAMSNNPAKLAYFTGFYKAIQSAGAAGMWRADGLGVPYMTIFASTWALLLGGLVFMLPMIYWRVHEHQEETIVTVGGTEQVVRKEVAQ
jgi:hypothetical protein